MRQNKITILISKIKKRNKCIFLLLSTIISIGISSSQTVSNYKPNEPTIRPNSPNASSLGEYGKIPVSYFNGTTDISIPIYEIDLNGMKIPVALSYNSSGIKVSQESTCVGLGWSLNAGGCFTRQINDGDDYLDNLKQGRTKIPYYNARDTLKSILNTDIYQLTPQRIRNYDDNLEIMDTEPDIYFFNFCNYQGSTFFPYNDSKVEFRGYIKNIKQYLRIKWTGRITAYDGYGYNYSFGSNNNSTEFTDGNSTDNSEILATSNSCRFVDDAYYQKSKTAFYLDTIAACNGDVVTFNYSQDTIYTVPITSESYKSQLNNFRNPGQAAETGVKVINNYSSTVNNAKITQSVLKKITFKNGCIDFITSSDRKDLESACNKRTQRITDIIIKRDSSSILVESKHYKLYTSYLGDTTSNVSCRLLLDSILEISRSGLKNQKYVFTYNKGRLPAKNSRQIDYWGFYNKSTGPSKWGYSNNINMLDEGTAIPSYSFDNISSDFSYSYCLGRNRMPDKERMQYGMLTKITYPTGGETEFVYEPHDFSNSFTYEKSDLNGITDLGLAFTTSSDNSNGSLTLMTKYNTSNPYQIQPTTYQSTNIFKKNNRVFISFAINSNADIITKIFANINVSLITSSGSTSIYGHNIDFDQDNGHVYNFTIPQDGKLLITLTPTYNYVAQNPNYNNIAKSLSLTAKLDYINGIDTLNYGGGLRVKEITDYIKSGSDRTAVTYKKLTYTNSKGTTSGCLYSIPKMMGSYTRQIIILGIANAPTGLVSFLDGTDNNYTLVDCPYIDTLNDLLFTSMPFTNCMFTSDIAYSQVEETESKDNTYGKTVYNYIIDNNNSGPSFPGDKVFVSGTNGLQRSIKQYDSNNNPEHEVSFTYTRDSNEECTIKGLSKHQNFSWFGDITCSPFNPLVIERRTVPTFSYNTYTLRADWNKLVQKTDKSYFNQGKDSVLTTTQFEYDPVNYLCNKTSTISSDRKNIEERVNYSYIDDLMKGQSKMNFPLTKSKYVDNTFIESLNTNYSLINLGETSTSLPSSIQYQTANSIPKTYIDYNGYDFYGNHQSIVWNSSQKSSYIWSYKGAYPIFEIKNASYDEVKTALGYTDTQMISLTKSSTPDVAGLRNKLDTYFKDKSVQITSFTYNPLIGAVTQTDPRGVTTYYTYDTFNRLQTIKDAEGSIIQKYDYNYQH